MPSSFVRCLVLLLAVFAHGRSDAGDSGASEQILKAAFLYNFAVYTDWPAPPAEEFRFCTIGYDRLGNAIDALAGKLLRGKPVVVRRLDNPAEIASCHVLYVGPMTAAQRLRLGRALAQLPILTVGDTEAGDIPEVMIRLLASDGRIAFEIDQTMARATGLVLNSMLLRLARTVR